MGINTTTAAPAGQALFQAHHKPRPIYALQYPHFTGGKQNQRADKQWNQDLGPKLFESQRHTMKLPKVIVLKF